MRGLVQIVLGLIIGVIGAAWAGPARNMLAEPSARYLGDYADAAPIALLVAGGLYVVTGALTMILSGLSNLFAAGAEKKKAARRLDLFHELLTGATVRMVGTDGKVAPAELAMVAGVLEKFGREPIPEKTIRSISQSFVKDPDRYLKMMSEKSGEITDEQKASILRACLLVAMADVESDASELAYLRAVAEALKVAPERLAKIHGDVSNVTQKLIGAAAFAA